MRGLKSGAHTLSRAPAQIGAASFDDDQDRADGKFDVLAGLPQEKYGYTREQAANEIDKHRTEYGTGIITR